jgi:hypothetical protein
MRRPTLIVVSCLVVATLSTATATAAAPPRPGTTESGLTESEEATLWSNTSTDNWATPDGQQSAVHEIATQTDLTFTKPPSTAKRWNRYAHDQFQPGGIDESVHPESMEPYSGPYIKDAHASIFSLTPSTWTYTSPGETRLYAAPEGRLRGAVDYRIEVPESRTDSGWSHSWELQKHDIETVRLLVNGEEVETKDGIHRPEFSYALEGRRAEITLEARIEATLQETIRPPPRSHQTTKVITHRRWVTVSNTYTVDVYDLDPTAVSAVYPDGHEGISITQAQPWQGYTLDTAGDREIRGIWRFFTARGPDWRRLVSSSEMGTEPHESHALPVYVHAYPSAMAPRAKPEHTVPTILQTWGPTHESPASSLPKHVSAEVVSGSYNETYEMGVRADQIDPETVTVNGIVHGTETGVRQMLAEPQRIREAELSASVTKITDSRATVLVELEDTKTGEPIELGAQTDALAGDRDRPGYIELGEKRVRTNASGQVTVQLTSPGAYSARYVPASWMDVYPAYTGDTATVQWHPLQTIGGWIELAIRFGQTVLPLAVTYYAGRRLASMFTERRNR